MENQINIYEEFGKAMMDLEMVQARVNHFRSLIMQEINKQNLPAQEEVK